MTMSKRLARGLGQSLVLMAVVAQAAAPVGAYAHGGGGHGGGFGGGHGGGFGGGGRSMPGGFSGGRDFGGGRDMGGRDFGPRDFGGSEAARRFDGGAALDGGGRLDGGRGLEGDRGLDGGRDFGPGHFAGDGHISRADFQRIADRGIDRGGVGRAAAVRDGVRPYSMNTLANRGDAIRNNFYHGGWYGGRGWYGAHFNAWWPGRWWGGYGWGLGVGMLAGLAWGDLAGWGGYATAPVAYDYGTTVAYADDGVYVQGARVGTAEQYAEQAATLASQGGPETKVAVEDQWRPLGVFALARAEETSPSTFMSLAIDKDGLLRGSYYDAVSETTMNITGKVDKKTQRAAWTLGDKKTPVYEAGLANLTRQQTTILVHRDGGKVEQMLLVRVQDGPNGDDAAAGAAKPASAAASRSQVPPGAEADEDGDKDEVDGDGE
jgi:hypothetical protein